MSNAIGQHQPCMAKLEIGRCRPDVVEYIDIAKVIGFDPVAELQVLSAQFDLPSFRGNRGWMPLRHPLKVPVGNANLQLRADFKKSGFHYPRNPLGSFCDIAICKLHKYCVMHRQHH